MNSREKGKRGEREAAKELTRIGLGEARRGVQYNGLDGHDVLCANLDYVHLEVKRVEQLQLYPAVEQAVRDAQGLIPAVMHRRNQKPWVFIVRADDVVNFARAVLRGVEKTCGS